MGMYIKPVKETDERETPDDLWNKLNLEFHFTLDVCASEQNHKCSNYYTKEINSLNLTWTPHICWMNPPYSQTSLWMEKAYNESLRGATVVCLIPSATDTRWWHEYAVKGQIRFIKGRLRFKNTNGSAPFPSALVIFKSNGDT